MRPANHDASWPGQPITEPLSPGAANRSASWPGQPIAAPLSRLLSGPRVLGKRGGWRSPLASCPAGGGGMGGSSCVLRQVGPGWELKRGAKPPTREDLEPQVPAAARELRRAARAGAGASLGTILGSPRLPDSRQPLSTRQSSLPHLRRQKEAETHQISGNRCQTSEVSPSLLLNTRVSLTESPQT